MVWSIIPLDKYSLNNLENLSRMIKYVNNLNATVFNKGNNNPRM